MKNCDWTAQAAADGGSSDPENHEKEQKKRPASQHSPRTRFFLKNIQKRCENWSPKMTPLGLGNNILHTFWTLGLRAAQKVCTKLPREDPGTPNGPPKVPKLSKMVAQSEPKLEHSVKNNIKRLKKTRTKTTTKQKGESITASPASLTWPAQPAQLILASIASPAQPSKPAQPAQHSQHPTAHTPRVGAGGRGRSP